MTGTPPEVRRTALEWARDVARAYRWALKAAAPEKCDELDRQAIEAGQRWVAPTVIPTPSPEVAMEAILSPGDIETGWGIPASTVRAWSAKGLLTNHGKPRAPRYKVSEVLECEGRRRKRA